MQKLSEVCCPLFTAIACRKQPDLQALVENLSLYNKDTCSLLLHLPASGLTKAQALKFLNDAKDIGVNSIFALRGDIRKDHSIQGDFSYAIDLVAFIRKHFGSYFTVCVAGYPERHPESESVEQDLYFLKQKVEAGADFIITQMFFKCETFIKYEERCRYVGITVPIIPGIMPIKSYESLQQVTKRCHVAVPKEILEALEPIRGSKEKVKDFGTHLAAQMVNQLLPISNAVHFFTLNSLVHPCLEPVSGDEELYLSLLALFNRIGGSVLRFHHSCKWNGFKHFLERISTNQARFLEVHKKLFSKIFDTHLFSRIYNH